MRTCVACGTAKDVSEFYNASQNKDGLTGKCKGCVKATVRAKHRETNRARLAGEYGSPPTEKRCKSCEVIQPASNFSARSASRDGLQGKCRTCFSEYDRQPAPRARRLAYGRLDSTKEAMALWVRKPEVMAKNRVHGKKYRRTPKGQIVGARGRQKRRCAVASAPNDLTEDQWAGIKDYFDHRCAYCGRCDLPLAMDHVIPVSKGGGLTRDNIVPACKPCNSSKNNKSLLEFLGMWPVPR